MLHTVKQLIKPGLARLTANERSQKMLYSLLSACGYLMGIGSGARPECSGEEGIVELLPAYSGPYTIFDVGANKGQFLQKVSSLLPGDQASFHCFEPSAHTYALLEEAAAGQDHVVLNRLALSAEAGEATLYSNSPGSGLASLTQRDLSHLEKEFNLSESVQVSTIDRYCIEHQIEHIHLLKLDIEGHEMDALRGATETFAAGKIDLVTFEFGGTHIDTRSFLRDFYQFFRDHEMQLYRITPTGYCYPLDCYRELDEQFVTTNFLARRPEPNA